MLLHQSGSTLLHLIGRKMRQNMAQFKDNPHITEAHWYEIDETTHGSVVTYHSKEAY